MYMMIAYRCAAHTTERGNESDGGKSNTVSLNEYDNIDEDNKAIGGDLLQTRTCYTSGT